MQLKFILSAVVLASLSTGCAVGPDYVRPSVPLGDRFMGQASGSQQQAAPSAELIAWWSGFDDPKLSQLIKRALEQNLDLAQASTRVAQARAGLGAANAAMLPSGNVSGQAVRAYQSIETPLGQVLDSSPSFNRHGNAYEANLGASWELDIFGGLRRGREAALAGYQASEAEVAATRLAVAAQTADIYISIRGLQARLEVARRQIHTQQELLSLVKLLHEKGLAAELQVARSEGALAQVLAAVPVLESALDTNMNALDVMLGSAPGTHRAELVGGGAIPSAPKIGATGSPRDLLRRRPDLIIAERRLAAANAQIGVAIADYYPKVSLSGLLGSATSVSGSHLFTSGAGQAFGALGLRWRLFDFGRINAQIDHARGKEAEMLVAYRLAALRATEDVENALSAMGKREEQASSLVRGVESLGRARAASFAGYQKGANSLTEVLQVDESLLRASDAQVQAQTEASRAAVSAFKALGGGWQPRPSDVAAGESLQNIF